MCKATVQLPEPKKQDPVKAGKSKQLGTTTRGKKKKKKKEGEGVKTIDGNDVTGAGSLKNKKVRWNDLGNKRGSDQRRQPWLGVRSKKKKKKGKLPRHQET